jgi:BlaI family penicillinase repressor
MRVLWDQGEATARHITEVMNASAPTTHSTVQTLLRQLETKGAIAHERRDRTFVYRPLIAETAVGRSMAKDVLDRVFQGSISGLVAHLLDNEEVPPDEIARLRTLVDEKMKEGAR